MDSYIVASFWLHLLCLYLGSTIGKKQQIKIKKRHLVSAALFGAGLDVVAMILLCEGSGTGAWIMIVFVVAEFLVSARIAYGKHKVLQNSLLLFVITALLAGVFQLIPVKNVGLFCLTGTLLLPGFIHGITTLFRTKQVQQMLYEGVLYFGKQQKCMCAFMDTGNRLRLYGSSIPVVLVDERILSEWVKEAKEKIPQKLVYLPYKGVGGKGLLQGVRLQCKIITGSNGAVEGEVAAVVAEHRLFHGCQYQMILQPEVLSMVCVRNTQEGEQNVV